MARAACSAEDQEYRRLLLQLAALEREPNIFEMNGFIVLMAARYCA